MTKYIGNNGVAKIAGASVGGLTEIQINEAAAVADSSELGDTADKHIPGSTNWNGQLTVWWDDGDPAQAAAVAGASIAFAAYFQGLGSGGRYRTGTCTITSVGSAIRRNQTIQRTFGVTGNGALTAASVP